MTIRERIDEVKKEAEEKAAGYAAVIAFLEENADKIDAIDVTPTWFGTGLDFNDCTREQVLAVIKAFPGKWQKSLNYSGKNMDYVRDQLPGETVTLRIWSGALPPSCKVVKEMTLVPEHYEEKLVVKCGEKEESTAT